jgi:hypothetical protein
VITLAALLLSLAGPDASTAHDRSEVIGTWRGTSVCTDRVAAPACKDEVVVYDVTAGVKAGEVHWKADKVVNGERLTMGEMDMAYDSGDACWRAVFTGPRGQVVWCLAVEGTKMAGRAWLLPGKQQVRKVEAKKDGR